MKKYILLVGYLAFTTLCVYPKSSAVLHDSIDVIIKERIEKDLANIDFERIADLKIDMSGLKKSVANTKTVISNAGKVVRDYSIVEEENNDKTPTRVEKRSFPGINAINISHSYGNIIVKETSSKQVELEIHFFDTKTKNANCEVVASGKSLSIETGKGISRKSSNYPTAVSSNTRPQVNYIISVPRNVSFNVDMKYGNIKIDEHGGMFVADLSYSNLTAVSFSNFAPQIKARYSDMKIGKVKDFNISGSYSDIRITDAGNVEIEGNYNNYKIDVLQKLSTKGSVAYGDIKLKTAGSIHADLRYTDVVIDNLVSNMEIETAYGDITVQSVSSSLKSINVRPSYADVSIGLPQNIAVSFDVNLSYGDMKVSKIHNVNYTSSIEKGSSTIKKGKIGTKNPTASIIINPGSYSDLTIK